MTLASAFVAAVFLSVSGAKPHHAGPKPDTYSERWLCDLWAGAQCHMTSCEKDARDRCMASSKQCESTSKTTVVPKERAQKMSTCARAILQGQCGAAKPAECEGLL